METLLVTGVAGFIGSHVANHLQKKGHKIYGVDDLSSGKIENIPKEIEFIELNLASKNIENKLPKKVDKVIHLAGQSSGEISFENPVDDLYKNTISSLNLIDFSLNKEVKRFVYASSMSVYGEVSSNPAREDSELQPSSCYGVGKLASEKYLEVYKNHLPMVILRIFNVYGPGQDMENLKQGMISIYLSQALNTNSIEIKGSLERFRDFIHIDDVVKAISIILEEKDALNNIFNIGTGIKTTVRELISMIEVNFNNLKVSESSPTPGDQFGIYADINKMKRILNFSPEISLEEGLKSFIDWSRDK